jgi:hypothetical protein
MKLKKGELSDYPIDLTQNVIQYCTSKIKSAMSQDFRPSVVFIKTSALGP